MPASHETGWRETGIEAVVSSSDWFDHAGNLSLHISISDIRTDQFFANPGHICVADAHLISGSPDGVWLIWLIWFFQSMSARPLIFSMASSVGRVRTSTKLLNITIEWGMIRMNNKRSQVDVSVFDKYADTYENKKHNSGITQYASDVISTWPVLMMARYCEFKTMDAM